jgi:hypothetical protein
MRVSVVEKEEEVREMLYTHATRYGRPVLGL